MKTPDRIYLVDPDIDEEEDAGPGMAPDIEGVYWCEDRVHKSDVEYIRADLYAAQPPQDERGQPVALSTDWIGGLTTYAPHQANRGGMQRGGDYVRLADVLVAYSASLRDAYLEGVNVDRLREAMTFLGIAGYGQEETAARMAECINQVTQGVMQWKCCLDCTSECAVYGTAPKKTEMAPVSCWEGRVAASAPALQAGGEHRIFRDGNQWCAVGQGFKNLQESPAGFGDTPGAALEALSLDTPGNRNPECRYAGYKGEALPSNATDDQKAAWQEGKRASLPADLVTCNHCSGSGKVKHDDFNPTQSSCPYCDGEGAK